MRSWTALCMSVLIGVATLSAHAYRLAYKDNAGDVRNYQLALNMDGSASMGIDVPIKGTISMDSVEKVTAVRNGVADLTTEFSNGKINMVMAIPGGEGETQTIQQAMPNYGMVYSRTPSGAISNIRYTGDITKMVGNQFSALNGMQNIQGMVFPDRDLNIGDTWDSKSQIKMADGSQISVAMAYKLSGTQVVNGKTYLVIDCNSTAVIPKLKVAIPGGDADGNAAPLSIDMSMNMRGTTSMLFDADAGAYREAAMRYSVKMSMAGVGQDEASPITMTFTMDGKMARKN